ncbi:MAG: hypothetical protein EFT35_04120 [Methanophagales archaeon ANME-1-THS]|nr:MAG: hypothetical protein EFT35_04120 [Methanophagales archaeon ANME-1-THS]
MDRRMGSITVIALASALVLFAVSVAPAIAQPAPPAPYVVNGYVFYENGSACNGAVVNVTNLGSGAKWQADTIPTSNYYQLVLVNGTDVNASETLQFDLKSPDGTQSNVTNHTIIQQEIDNGGYFNFNISLEAKPAIFDTGRPENPYPSISGTHNGTIKPNKTIIVNKLYTYPCVGTGGHTEFAKIWNETEGVCAIANWGGYRGDYHNISFNTTLTLKEGMVYNYTIRTGSYPQVHHTPALPTANGWMNCSSFVDANGKIYYDWIPAIKLL